MSVSVINARVLEGTARLMGSLAIYPTKLVARLSVAVCGGSRAAVERKGNRMSERQPNVVLTAHALHMLLQLEFEVETGMRLVTRRMVKV